LADHLDLVDLRIGDIVKEATRGCADRGRVFEA
jgi:hypothetical protein